MAVVDVVVKGVVLSAGEGVGDGRRSGEGVGGASTVAVVVKGCGVRRLVLGIGWVRIPLFYQL
jgi:hypothetical protein